MIGRLFCTSIRNTSALHICTTCLLKLRFSLVARAAISSDCPLEIRLYINGTEIENFRGRAEANGGLDEYKFLTKGLKVAATEIIKLTVKHDGASASIGSLNRTKLMLFEEATGESPAIV